MRDAVAGLSVRVLLTVGRDLDTAQLGIPPSNVRIERWVDQADVMADAVLVVCHGGAGTTLGAVAVVVPMVVFRCSLIRPPTPPASTKQAPEWPSKRAAQQPRFSRSSTIPVTPTPLPRSAQPSAICDTYDKVLLELHPA